MIDIGERRSYIRFRDEKTVNVPNMALKIILLRLDRSDVVS